MEKGGMAILYIEKVIIGFRQKKMENYRRYLLTMVKNLKHWKRVFATTLAVIVSLTTQSHPFTVHAANNVLSEDVKATKSYFSLDDSSIALIEEAPERLTEKYSDILSVEKIELDDLMVEKIAHVVELDQNGNECEVEGVEYNVTLTKIVCDNSMHTLNTNNKTSTHYVLYSTATHKESTGSDTRYGVTVTGCIGWTDNAGIFNDFEYVNGARSGSYSGTAKYYALNGTISICTGSFNDSFSDTGSSTGMTFHLKITTPVQSGKTWTFEVSTSIFDT